MSKSNGLATRRRVSAVPKTLVFEVDVVRQDEETVIEVTGFVKGSHPVWVEIEVDAAWDAWRDASHVDAEVTDPESGETTILKVFQENPVAEATIRRDVLMAVTRGLEETDADVLAREDGPWLTMLQDLGWWRKSATVETPADPEATGEANEQTGSLSSPAPVPSTPEPTS